MPHEYECYRTTRGWVAVSAATLPSGEHVILETRRRGAAIVTTMQTGRPLPSGGTAYSPYDCIPMLRAPGRATEHAIRRQHEAALRDPEIVRRMGYGE